MNKKFKAFIVSLVTGWLIINGAIYLQQPSMIFYPIKEIEATPKEWGLFYEKVRIELADKTKISAWYLPHPEATKTVLFFHGNGGNISHRGDSLYIFHKLKLNVFIIDYAGYGESEGSPSEENLYQSAQAAWEYLLTEKKVDAENIIIFGRSLGGAVAVDLAAKVKAGGIILESTFSSVRDVADIVSPVMSHLIYLRYSFDSLKKIKKVSSPVLLIHSPADEVIPFELGQRLFESIQSKKAFLQIKGGHNDGFMNSISSYMSAIGSFSQSPLN